MAAAAAVVDTRPPEYDGAISGPLHGRRPAPVECAPARRVARRRQVAAADAARARVCTVHAARATARTVGGRRGFLDTILSCAASVPAVRCLRPWLFSSSCRSRVRCVRFGRSTVPPRPCANAFRSCPPLSSPVVPAAVFVCVCVCTRDRLVLRKTLFIYNGDSFRVSSPYVY